MNDWRHNDQEARWEFGYDDLPCEAFVALAWVTDEMISRVATPAALAVRLWRSVGSVPPALQEHLPSQPPPVIGHHDKPPGAPPGARIRVMKIEVIECGRHHSPMRRRETHEDFQCVVPDCRNTLTDQELHRAIQDRPNLRRAVVSEFYDLPGGRID